MDTALLIASRRSTFKDTIQAHEIKSNEHARKLWPLFLPDRTSIVTWASSTRKEDAKRRSKAHFRNLPMAYQRTGIRRRFDEEEDLWKIALWDMKRRENDYYLWLSKRLSSPIGPILKIVDEIKQAKDVSYVK